MACRDAAAVTAWPSEMSSLSGFPLCPRLSDRLQTPPRRCAGCTTSSRGRSCTSLTATASTRRTTRTRRASSRRSASSRSTEMTYGRMEAPWMWPCCMGCGGFCVLESVRSYECVACNFRCQSADERRSSITHADTATTRTFTHTEAATQIYQQNNISTGGGA